MHFLPLLLEHSEMLHQSICLVLYVNLRYSVKCSLAYRCHNILGQVA